MPFTRERKQQPTIYNKENFEQDTQPKDASILNALNIPQCPRGKRISHQDHCTIILLPHHTTHTSTQMYHLTSLLVIQQSLVTRPKQEYDIVPLTSLWLCHSLLSGWDHVRTEIKLNILTPPLPPPTPRWHN